QIIGAEAGYCRCEDKILVSAGANGNDEPRPDGELLGEHGINRLGAARGVPASAAARQYLPRLRIENERSVGEVRRHQRRIDLGTEPFLRKCPGLQAPDMKPGLLAVRPCKDEPPGSQHFGDMRQRPSDGWG